MRLKPHSHVFGMFIMFLWSAIAYPECSKAAALGTLALTGKEQALSSDHPMAHHGVYGHEHAHTGYCLQDHVAGH